MNSIIDIYFWDQYAKIYEEIENGKVEKFVYRNENGEIYYQFIKRLIPIKISDVQYYDITTPYGYGGPIVVNFVEDKLDQLVNDFNSAFLSYCKKNNIVSEFIRFHPLEKNHIYFEDIYQISFNRKTIYIDLNSEETIWSNMKSTSRNRIRKAKKNNIKIEENSSCESLYKFIELYYKTMNKNSADDSYYFDKSYFEKILELNFSKIFNAIYQEKTISSIIVLTGDKYIHYHLGATDPEFYAMSPNNILFYEVAKWGCENGYKKFHLGGGYKDSNDSLFRFKKSLNKNGETEFYLGKRIHNQEVYNKLVDKHKKLGELNEQFFPLYRSPIVKFTSKE